MGDNQIREYAKGFYITRDILADDITEDDIRAALWYAYAHTGEGDNE